MRQIAKLLELAIVEGLNERNLRQVVGRIDWREHRRLLQRPLPAITELSCFTPIT